MKTQILNGEKEKTLFSLDPRTKLVMLLAVAVFVLGGAGGNALTWARITLAFMPAALIFFSGRKKAFLKFMLLFLAGCFLQYVLLGRMTGILNFIILASAGILSQFLPGFMMGYYTVATTTVSEFMAAMERIHMPEQISIPMSVMFRFFPTVGEEAAGISDAMKMRGIALGGKHPGKMVEYRLVPLMTCSVKIGEELSAAALTRGLGAPVKRTNICKIGFGILDLFFLILCGAATIHLVLVFFGGVQ